MDDQHEGTDANAGIDGDFADVRDRMGDHVTWFVRDLRRAGVDVPGNAGIDAMRALATVGVGDFWRARAALRATLLTRKGDMETFDRMFHRFWDELQDALAAVEDREGPPDAGESAFASDDDGPRQAAPDEEDGESTADSRDDSTDNWQGDRESSAPSTERASADEIDDPAGSAETQQRRSVTADEGGDGDDSVEASMYSQVGRPKTVDVAGLVDGDGLSAAVRELTRSIADLSGRRWTHTAAGTKLDTRQALRRSFGTGGTVLEVPRRTRRTTEVRAILLVDVSRSVLDTIDRGFLIRFLRTLYAEWRDVRIFFFDTDVREVTDQFAAPSADAAVRALQRAETTWGGGTRIGHAIESLHETAPQSVDRETAVFVISDGLEMGETDELEEGIAWLARRANTVLWLNPLAASSAYEPTCRGMELSLPYVDGLFAFTGPDDVAEIARQLRLRGPGGSVGYEHDRSHRDS